MEQLGGLGAPDYAAVYAFCRNLKGSVFTLFQHFEGVCAGGDGNNGRGVFRRGKKLLYFGCRDERTHGIVNCHNGSVRNMCKCIFH